MGRCWRLAAIAAALAILAACATAPPAPVAPPPIPAPPAQPAPSPAPPAAPPRSTPPPRLSLHLADLPGWAQEDHAAALLAFEAGCSVAPNPDMAAACRRARNVGALGEAAARDFLEANFRAEPVGDGGLLTAYFAPEYEARASRRGEFTAPVRARPADLVLIDLGQFDPTLTGRKISGRIVGGQLVPYPDRAAIEAAPADAPLAWMRPEDLFFLQIQGSGVLRLPEGRRLKAVYAGNNGRPFVGVANILRDRGALAAGDASAEAVRNWLAVHRGPEADAVMRQDPRYVFFRLEADDGAEPVGTAGVPLIPGRSLAVDPARHAMGGLYWIDAVAPTLNGAMPAYRRIAMALDTGGAIKGEVRADLYIGAGAAAGLEAGRVRHVLSLYALAPVGSATQ
ncbi:MltA domain-containing protein [Phenylobacterium montanum]|uniref:peptidoglycan lytic exotransglycosylase n=1 Tax=Phenylobacterium montanum TaxID=2823693 RepID=A0A975FWQ4_9CAUL|nr:MltA domain-containing protein [Caulobacter sp. S6]QUD86659.1 MltA domain-containing protein [Caulobacter sp. S6]